MREGGEKKCELCGVEARARCESDGADLCWECDAEVHGANFLVARHSRRLLCRRCQRPTPWRADGPRLGPTVSVCLACFGRAGEEMGRRAGGADGDNQVVPLAAADLAAPPPRAAARGRPRLDC